ncbi:MAG: DUF2970 domain-containing protein [Pseudomonadales bacterium]|jgi:hypothetical protein|nr:DUF2970 domain-containing protein [Gammaproteobacteria bacterium]MBP6050621.1 DUF2970 domain-containing protein [Pseudomonadales bacterium]MBK6585436.1 DUF2970 domain-containing protein [Gammaproteobacteria bacterium]MBK7168915.1 DUF2970 domain-containing protein [Gammaproteobacteria bacterium]MBK7521068.1 DUF2970 domain-containing protein [Gammaproteobacteria bacterium]
MNERSEDPSSPRQQPPPVTFGTLIRSVAAAAFGVQSSKNKERDFSHGNSRHFIIAGILFAAAFVATVALVVSLVLRTAGAH